MREINVNKAEKLLKEVQKKCSEMEYRTIRFKGHTNVSRADMEMLEMRLEQAIGSGYYDTNGYIRDEFVDSLMETVCI